MCEFCNRDKINWIKDEGNTRLYLMEDTMQRWIIGAECDSCRSDDFVEIKFCPICGKELIPYIDILSIETTLHGETSDVKQIRLDCTEANGINYWDCYNDCAFWDGKICTKHESPIPTI